MKYKIKVTYTTGDSFSSYDVTEDLEYEFEDLNVAIRNLENIHEHALFVKQCDSYHLEDRHEILKTVKSKEWFVDDNQFYYSLYLILDDGRKVRYRPAWMGYFESLINAQIVLPYKIEILDGRSL